MLTAPVWFILANDVSLASEVLPGRAFCSKLRRLSVYAAMNDPACQTKQNKWRTYENAGHTYFLTASLCESPR